MTKSFFFMLVLIISRKESVTSKNIDMYLAPLIEELLELWRGINVVDASSPSKRQIFKVRAILL